MRLQRRVFSYLAILLAVFIAVQLMVYTFVEYRGWREHPEEPLSEELEEVVDALALNVMLLPLMLLLAWRLTRRILAPVHRIVDTAQRIGGSRLDERIDTAGMPDDDMRHLAQTLNHAFDRYAAAVRRLQRFGGDASHQLRTPLAALRAAGEVSLSRPREAADYRQTIQDMLAEVERITFMIEQLLHLSQLETGALRDRFTNWDPAAPVRQCVQLFAPLSEEAGVELVCRVENGLTVSGIEALAGELLGNLLDNAIRHTPRGGTIHLGVRRAGHQALFHVHDSGPGIPAAYAAVIFERFMQIPGGCQGRAGLGLALAADIATVHGGKLELVNPGEAGARFEWRLPLLD